MTKATYQWLPSYTDLRHTHINLECLFHKSLKSHNFTNCTLNLLFSPTRGIIKEMKETTALDDINKERTFKILTNLNPKVQLGLLQSKMSLQYLDQN